jgi:flagellin-like hook-associated protein FlgL
MVFTRTASGYEVSITADTREWKATLSNLSAPTVTLSTGNPADGTITLSGNLSGLLPYLFPGDSFTAKVDKTPHVMPEINSTGPVTGTRRTSSNGGNGAHSAIAELGLAASVETAGTFGMLARADALTVRMERMSSGGYFIQASVGCLSDAVFVSREALWAKEPIRFDFGDANYLDLEVVDPTRFDYQYARIDNMEFFPGPGLFATENAIVQRSGKALTLQVGPEDMDVNRLAVEIRQVSTATLGTDGLRLKDMSVATYEKAQLAIMAVHASIDYVSVVRAQLGSYQNRLEHTVNNLNVTLENITAAESRLRDADIARLMTVFTKTSILAQSSQAMLAQANMQPQQVLQIMK